MSGFVGIVNRDGAPVDPDLLGRMTDSIVFRGPDGRNTWIQGNAGFGHTMLRTTPQADREVQPCTVDGLSWIIADCRIDAREELIGELVVQGRAGARDATDPELILHAYGVWGARCVEHLIGDFAFAIHDTGTDAGNGRLFCARDHLGVKPFYYAETGGVLVFANTLNSLWLHPAVSNALNETALGDFLLFGFNQEVDTTSFRDIKALPAGWCMTVDCDRNGGPRVVRYWNPTAEPLLRLRDGREYEEQFLELLRAAVRDRLPADGLSLALSGGLDSGGLAAMAKELAAPPLSTGIAAFTAIYKHLIPDHEAEFASQTAAWLGIPIHFYVRDEETFFECSHYGDSSEPPSDLTGRFADPAFIPHMGPAPKYGIFGAMAQNARVGFWGEGPDNALTYDWRGYVRNELRERHYGRLCRELISFPFQFGELPFSGRRRAERQPVWAVPEEAGGGIFPAWLNPGFVERCGLRERFERLGQPAPLRDASKRSAQMLLTPIWRWFLEDFDPGVTRLALEMRHPYLDLRVQRFMLRLPAIPWCRKKYLMRRVLGKRLPEVVVRREKQPLAGFPIHERWNRSGAPELPEDGMVRAYVDIDNLRTQGAGTLQSRERWLRVCAIDLFLRNMAP